MLYGVFGVQRAATDAETDGLRVETAKPRRLAEPSERVMRMKTASFIDDFIALGRLEGWVF
jgi:hypothetical protein